MDIAIEVRDLWYKYPNGVEALRGINLDIRRGELVAIVGENGAGKTTLVKHFIGLLKPWKGYVRVLGNDTKELSVAQLARKVGFVFQNPDHQLFAETVREEIAFALKNFKFSNNEIKKRVNLMLERFELSKYADKSPLLLSGGERKRVTIACALAYDPEIIIFDEPTIGQDYRQKSRIGEMIIELSREGKTVIIVTHDMTFVAEYIPRMIVMTKGKVIADGSSESIFSDPSILEAAKLLPPQVIELSWSLSKKGFNRLALRIDTFVNEYLKIVRKYVH